MMIRLEISFFVFLSILFTSCTAERPYPWLEGLDADKEYLDSGVNLMAVEFGLNSLEIKKNTESHLLIAVHGSNSLGYEWIYPLQTLDNEETLTLFFRWDDNGCPAPSFKILNEQINQILDQNNNVNGITIMGHSYGALLVSMFAESWSNDIPVEIHAIAGPLADIYNINFICDYQQPRFISTNLRFYEWRTQKHLDGAFKDLDVDPQIINLQDSIVTRLPENYRGRRLGHNWSISWVADELNQR
jgi:hypothetical protein